jgi:ribose transport system permease protein
MGKTGFGVGEDLKTIIYTTVYSGLISLAFSYNLTCGRLDFSIGATLILSAIIGGNLAAAWNLPAIGMLILIVAVGAVLGLISGLVYVLLGLPPMITAIGMTMIYEAIGLIYNNAEGVRLIGRNDLLVFAKLPNLLIILGIVLIVLIFLYNFTRFGYNWNSLQNGQKVAVDVGINEKRNAVACYVIAGVLLGLAATIYLSRFGTIAPEVGLTSSSYFMGAFLPLFIGGAIDKYSDKNIGVMIGALTQAFLTSGLSKVGASSSMQTVLNGLIVMGFLIYSFNKYKLVEVKMFKEKRKAAQAAKESSSL